MQIFSESINLQRHHFIFVTTAQAKVWFRQTQCVRVIGMFVGKGAFMNEILLSVL